ncbi:hypothetical protein FRB91_011295 [Serendipita sp. 411]|nr:hypothetical protein FRB91_011295 [Serendipita sp. 411]
MPIWSSAWYERSDRGSIFSIKLPIELWAMIIDLIVIPLRHPYLYCEPETFPQYDNLLSTIALSDQFPFLDDWKRVSAVCKEWKHLAGVKPCLFLKEEPCPGVPESDIHRATPSVFIYGRVNECLAMKRIAHLKENLTTLALGYNTQWGAEALDILLDDPSMFPNLRCLSLGSNRTTRPFWKVIQDEFSNLVSLTIRYGGYGKPGVYVLKKLEILSIYTLDGFQLVCPSLKHLHIHYTKGHAADDFIMEHGHQLQSFIGFTESPLYSNKGFWSLIFPNLVTFGCGTWIKPSPAPSNHPLRHLRLISAYNSLTPEHVMARIDAYTFPGLESIQIIMNDMAQGTTDELRARCRERGVRLIEIVDGIAIIRQQPRTTIDYIKTFSLCILLVGSLASTRILGKMIQ